MGQRALLLLAAAALVVAAGGLGGWWRRHGGGGSQALATATLADTFTTVGARTLSNSTDCEDIVYSVTDSSTVILKTDNSSVFVESLNVSHVHENVSTTTSTEFQAGSVAVENVTLNASQVVNTTAEEDIDYVKMGQDLLIEATTILDNGVWDFEKRTEDGDAIFSRGLDTGHKVYRLTGIVDMPPPDLLVILYDGLAEYNTWNPTLLECRVLEKINEQTDISYTVSAPGARGLVSSRDFVGLRHWELRHNTYVVASKSIDFPGAPSDPDYIRGRHGPGCFEMRPLSSDSGKTEFRWLLNTRLNGWIPSYIADKAYKKFMTRYMIFLREYCAKLKQRAVSEETTPPQNTTH